MSACLQIAKRKRCLLDVKGMVVELFCGVGYKESFEICSDYGEEEKNFFGLPYTLLSENY